MVSNIVFITIKRALRLAGLFAVIGILSAFTLQPISQNFSTSGPESSKVFQVHNPGAQPIAMRVEMLERHVDADGVESNPSASGSFAVFPTQFVLDAGQRRNIRVRYTGTENLDRERSFRLLAEQLPVDFSDPDQSGGAAGAGGGDSERRGEGSIQIMFRYLASVFVVPAGAEGPRPSVSIAERTEEAEAGLLLRFENEGGRHVVLQDLELRLELDDGTELPVTGNQLEGIVGTNLLAGAVRVHFLPLAADLVGRVRHVRYVN